MAFPQAQIHAVDISPAALVVACENAKRYQLLERIKFYTGSWFQPLTTLKGQVSGVVSNPPYIPTAEVAHLQPEVFQHEPHLALDGGLDGLDAIRHLIAGATEYLVPGGIWLVEAMAGQATEIVRLLQQQGSYANIQVYSDLAGIDRFVLAIRV
jgi:release factor glutamine methyltransferase